MPSGKAYLSDPFNRLEIVFFPVYFLLFNLLTDVEYRLYESHISGGFLQNIPASLLSGINYGVPFFIFYKLAVQPVLLKKRYLLFLGCLVIFVVLENLEIKYSYWLVPKLSFLPARMRVDALKWYKGNGFMYISVIYTLRELMVICCLAYFIKSVKQERVMNALAKEQLRAELKYLKIQLQPHFFFNTLNNIYALTLQGSAEAAPLVARHSEMMRYILYESTRQQVSLEQEIGFLKNYAAVEQVRYGKQASIHFDTQGIREGVSIEPLLLLPFIENAFKHGLQETIDAGYISIIICLTGDELTMEVSNSRAKPPAGTMPGAESTQQKGIGLENISKRLSILYADRHQLETKETETDYEIRLTLQLAPREQKDAS